MRPQQVEEEKKELEDLYPENNSEEEEEEMLLVFQEVLQERTNKGRTVRKRTERANETMKKTGFHQLDEDAQGQGGGGGCWFGWGRSTVAPLLTLELSPGGHHNV